MEQSPWRYALCASCPQDRLGHRATETKRSCWRVAGREHGGSLEEAGLQSHGCGIHSDRVEPTLHGEGGCLPGGGELGCPALPLPPRPRPGGHSSKGPSYLSSAASREKGGQSGSESGCRAIVGPAVVGLQAFLSLIQAVKKPVGLARHVLWPATVSHLTLTHEGALPGPGRQRAPGAHSP